MRKPREQLRDWSHHPATEEEESVIVATGIKGAKSDIITGRRSGKSRGLHRTLTEAGPGYRSDTLTELVGQHSIIIDNCSRVQTMNWPKRAKVPR